MMRGMYSAISGLKTNQIALDTTANNLANVNTVGFKSARTTFMDSMLQTLRGAAASSPAQGGTNAEQIGLGVGLAGIDNLMTGGATQTTGGTLDVAIQGEGWFRISPTDPPTAGNIQYTRAGNFTRNDQGYLTTEDGYYVVGRNGAGGADATIQIPPGSSSIAIGTDGTVSYIPAGGGARVTAGILSLAKFANEAGLVRNGGNRWQVSASSGPEQVNNPGGTFGTTQAGALEMSNVDMATEFTNMIVAQRGFQANTRVMTTADDMLQDLVNLKR